MRRLPHPISTVAVVGLSLSLASPAVQSAPPTTRPAAPTIPDSDAQQLRALLAALHDAERQTGVKRVEYNPADGTVVALRLHGDSATDRNVKLLPALPTLRSVTLYAPRQPLTPDAIASLAQLPDLETLELCGASESTDAATIRQWTRLAALTNLSIKYTRLPPDAVAALAELRNVRTLDLAFTDLTDAGLPTLARLQGLTHLSVTGTGVTFQGVRKSGMRATVRGAKPASASPATPGG